jgi:hypothetical protein
MRLKQLKQQENAKHSGRADQQDENHQERPFEQSKRDHLQSPDAGGKIVYTDVTARLVRRSLRREESTCSGG